MRAWKVNSFGEPADVLTLETDAESFEAKSNQVKIKVEGKVVVRVWRSD